MENNEIDEDIKKNDEEIIPLAPCYIAKSCKLIDFFRHVKHSKQQDQETDWIFKESELINLVELINNTGLVFNSTALLHVLIKRRYINDLEFVCDKLNPKLIARNTSIAHPHLAKLNLALRSHRKYLRMDIKAATDSKSIACVTNRFARFEKIAQKMELLLSRIHVLHAAQFEPKRHKTCTIS